MSIPAWVRDAIFYQIFPDRFVNGDPGNDPINVREWGSPPDHHHYQGGDLAGIVSKLDYLSDLGVNALYLNPIFLSTSTHRYNTSDYYRIDPFLGDEKVFSDFLTAVHRRNMRVLLDGVFNHCGRGFFAFVDVLENGGYSPYKDWFHINRFPLEAYSAGKENRYAGWWGYKSLPKFNTTNPAVRKYLIDVGRYWVEKGIDGWRLDVPNEIDDDDFWAEFREAVRQANPEALTVGEIWDINPRWVGDDHFDGLMHYPLRSAIIKLLKQEIDTAGFIDDITRIQTAYPAEHLFGMYLLLGSHDTERVRTILKGDKAKNRLAFDLLFAFPGAPAIYYGDEIGLEGGKDPDCRRAFSWDQKQWDHDLHGRIRKLTQFRNSSGALRHGEMLVIGCNDDKPGIMIRRKSAEETVWVIINPGGQKQRLVFDVFDQRQQPPMELKDALDQQVQAVETGQQFSVELNPWSCAYFRG